MKLYLLSQEMNRGYDTYDSVVVCAENEEEARIINPGGFYVWENDSWCFHFSDGRKSFEKRDDTWCLPSEVKVEEIGIANDSVKAGVVLSSFNAG